MAAKRYYKATEVEAMLQEAREKLGFVGKTEINSVNTMVETAKRNGRIGDKVLITIPAVYVHIPSWQRRLDMNRSRTIGSRYIKHKWEVPKVIFSKGKLFCVDGMHRIVGAFIAENIEYIVVEILTDITEKEAIELFLDQTKDRSAMAPCDYYYASLEAEKKEYIYFKEICHKHNVQIKGDDALLNPIGTFTSTSDGVKLCKVNPELLDNILNLLCKLQWNKNEAIKEPDKTSDKCFGAKYIRTILRQCKRNGKDFN